MIPDPHDHKKLIAVEVVRIEEEGRIATDGRLKVGDQITEINGTPCSQVYFNLNIFKCILSFWEISFYYNAYS